MTEQEIQTVDAAVRWITALSGSFLIPLVIILTLLYLLGSKRAPERLAHLMQPFSSFKFLGTEFVVSDAVKVSASAETTLRGYRADTKAKYEALVERNKIVELHKKLINDVLGPAIGGLDKAEGFRSTIHVRDILFAESYYQLIPYFPAGGGGDGRSFSIRYGIVGKTFRQGASNWMGDLKMSHANLIDLWGMTAEEATLAKSTRPALVAIVLRDATKEVVGILYADSNTVNAFGDTTTGEAVAAALEMGAIDGGLTAALANLVSALPTQPLIPMLGKSKA
jgi:hypothetical protein